jgi:3-oxoacid CoA-transferase B subunit
VPKDRRVIFHSENGVIGYGRLAYEDEIDPHAVNAGVMYVLLEPFAAIVNHAEAFAIIRKGMLDAAVLGAYEVAANGDFANWRLLGRKGGGIGGAMDIAACAQRLFVIMEHTTRDGQPRLLRQCTQPITAPGVVKLVMTDLGLFEPVGEGYRLLEIAPGYTPDEVQAVTDAPVLVEGPLKEVPIEATNRGE